MILAEQPIFPLVKYRAIYLFDFLVQFYRQFAVKLRAGILLSTFTELH